MRQPARDRDPITRRQALLRIGAGLVPLAGGCSWTAARPECRDGGAGSPAGLLSSIDTLVVVMMENRSFDHYLGALRLDPAYPAAMQVDGLRGTESNPDAHGRPVSAYRLDRLVFPSPQHSWGSAHTQWDEGRNDGFVRASGQREVMGYYDREVLPLYYALADRYTVCDRWFASVLGPTWPNRYYLHAATSWGIRDRTPMLFGSPPTIWDRMRERCLDVANYSAGVAPWYTQAFIGRSQGGDDALVPASMEEFFRAARQGTLPAFSLVDPDFEANDDHPPNSAALGQVFVASVVQALARGPQWPRCLLVVTYDEHGGFFDHVPPPPAVDPDPAFARLGFRVPAILVGPTVRRGHVDSTPREHVSVAATLATRFGIRSLGPRMDAARDLSACIDPDLIGKPAPPPRDLPRLSLPGAAVRAVPEGVRAWLRGALELDAVVLRG